MIFLTDDKKLIINDRKKLFIRFLKENNCYGNFVYYMRIRGGYFSDINVLVAISELNKTSEIYYSIDWENTKQGKKFWSDMNDKWKWAIKKYKENYG